MLLSPFRFLLAIAAMVAALTLDGAALGATPVDPAALVEPSDTAAPVVLTKCRTNATTLVTCASTAGLRPGMTITGPHIAAGTTVASIANRRIFTLSSAATGSGIRLTLTAGAADPVPPPLAPITPVFVAPPAQSLTASAAGQGIRATPAKKTSATAQAGLSSTGGTLSSGAGTTSAGTPPNAPVVAALTTYSNGGYDGVTWPSVATATSYLVQASLSTNFSSPALTATVTATRAVFANLVDGTTYYYRVAATNTGGTSAFSNVVSAIHDGTAPVVAIASPATGTSTAATTVTVTGTSLDATAGIASVQVNHVNATTTNAFQTWSATVPIGFGTTVVTATAVDRAGNPTTTSAVLITGTTAQTYNPLYIPDTLRGPTFNLTLDTGTKQYFSGPTTQTYSYNHAGFWGPTLIMRKGDFVQVKLANNLPATTTTHWHGLHIPAIMDGGPHEFIPAGTVWSPSFYIKNNAATYWYHPHLHPTTQQQLALGAGGLIILQDPEEAALALPRTYGLDDIPVVLTSRRFTTQGGGTNQIFPQGAFGDYLFVNGTKSAQVSLPAQVVRLRLLDAEVERNHNIGFSDNRPFYVIASDGGMLNAPVLVTRLVMAVGERYEILVNFSDKAPGSSLDLMTYNSGQAAGYPGGQANTTGPNGSLLNNIDFVDLHINIAAATTGAITAIPATLVNNVYWKSTDVTNNRSVSITGVGGNPLGFDNLVYSASFINQTINLDAIEQWTVTNNSNLAHSFHIHDIQFNLTSIPGGVPASMQGWKDTFYIAAGTSVSFIAKFDGFASNTNPFMYHCHFLTHEDGGLMAQFLVKNNQVEDLAVASFTRTGSDPAVHLQFKTTPSTTYTVQYSTDLTSSSWVDVGSVTSDGKTADFYETDPGRLAQARGFYRVAMPVITQ